MGLIIDSMNWISSSVRPYFTYSSASVQGFVKSWRGTKEYVSLVIFLSFLIPTKNLKNFVLVYDIAFSACSLLLNGAIARNVSVQIVWSSPNSALPIIFAGIGFPNCPAAPSAFETNTFHLLAISLFLFIPFNSIFQNCLFYSQFVSISNYVLYRNDQIISIDYYHINHLIIYFYCQ